jgi:hypothetical protein
MAVAAWGALKRAGGAGTAVLCWRLCEDARRRDTGAAVWGVREDEEIGGPGTSVAIWETGVGVGAVGSANAAEGAEVP